MIKDKEKLFYSAKEVGVLANVTAKTIRCLIINKQIPAVKVGKQYQIPKSYVDNLKHFSKTGKELEL